MRSIEGTAWWQRLRPRCGAFSFSFLILALVAACRGGASTPEIRLDASNPKLPIVEVAGLSRADVRALTRASLTGDAWPSVLRVAVRHGAASESGAGLAVAGRYTITDRAVRFTPMYGLDPGRSYDVVFDPAAVPGGRLSHLSRVSSTVAIPGVTRTPSTVVSAVYPSGGEVPANLLRMYVEFSRPMGQSGGLEQVAILDSNGREVEDAILPLETELWNSDRTRFTIFFDPGRVKRDILPNRRMGRPLRAGSKYTLIIRKEWLDAEGTPLRSEFRHDFRVSRADERALRTADWRIVPPAPGSRDALAITFPKPLDRGLLQRTIAVARNGETLPGDVRIDAGETRWQFVPSDPWQAGDHTLVILPVLEDPAGNRIGRPFEVVSTADSDVDAKPIKIQFRVS
jgi:hypothetical protein